MRGITSVALLLTAASMVLLKSLQRYLYFKRWETSCESDQFCASGSEGVRISTEWKLMVKDGDTAEGAMKNCPMYQ